MAQCPLCRTVAVFLCLGALILIAISCFRKPNTDTVKLGPWTRESNQFAFYLAADSGIFRDKFDPIRKLPHLIGDTAFYGMIQWGFTGDTLEDIDYDVLKDIDANGNDLFYFDRNNDEDLTNDGPPTTWRIDSTEGDQEYIELTHTMPDGFVLKANIVKTGDPLDESLTNKFGRPVLLYPLITHSARRGLWIHGPDTLPVEAFTMNPSGRFLGKNYEWIIIDVNKNGEYEFIPPDIRVLLSNPVFVLRDTTWKVRIDDRGTAIMIDPAFAQTPSDSTPAPSDTAIDPRGSIRLCKPAPLFATEDIDGNRLDLAALHGKVVVLNFWHTGCAPCISEIPALNRLSEYYNDGNVVFIAFTFDDKDIVRRFTAEKPFHYRLVANAGKISLAYDVHAYPVHFIVDKTGQIIYCRLGSARNIDKELRGLIDSLLAH